MRCTRIHRATTCTSSASQRIPDRVNFYVRPSLFHLIRKPYKHSSHRYHQRKCARLMSYIARVRLPFASSCLWGDEQREVLFALSRGGIPLRSSAAEGTSGLASPLSVSTQRKGAPSWLLLHPCPHEGRTPRRPCQQLDFFSSCSSYSFCLKHSATHVVNKDFFSQTIFVG